MRNETENNVFSFEAQKRKRELQNLEKTFKAYLSSLKQEQLQYESNYLINKLGEKGLSEEDLLKSALLMDELSKRMGRDQLSHTVNNFAEKIREKINYPELEQ